MGASVWKHSTQAGVKLSRARFLHDSCNVGSANPGAGNNGDAISGRCDQFGQYASAFESTLGATGCQNSARASLNDLFECSTQIPAIIERTMKGQRKRPRQYDKFPRSLHIHRTITRQDARYHPVHSCLLGLADGAPHLCKFSFRINEFASTRPDHSEDRNVQLSVYRPHQFDAGRNSSDVQVPAEFDTIRAAALSGQRCLSRLDAYFEQVSSLHFCSPEKRFKRVSVP